ncbi:T6SS immunity protein Tli4 family protein [Pseudoduganella chitinolytica]|uniref:T6SS immunity protein Tli4 family protein n=1 Tax=Pseudoduganella chitinolytica TaxID=34070 RepID=A0ABY8B833_9BURK|nr:T6SS immunity protein Tli4 family protein [Pseudoduganella chitinolytica]WEF32087.1 T6SS immunity protein Tli4 family protein [Pseudoduganella chitinolytica]
MSCHLRGAARIIIVTMLVVSSHGCGKSTSHSQPASVPSSPRIQKIFSNSKVMCFGRYVLRVPAEAELIWGSASVPSEIVDVKGNFDDLKSMVAKDIARLESARKTFELVFNGPGPVPSSWQIRYYEDHIAKKLDLMMFITYVNKDGRVFILRGAAEEKGEVSVVANQEAVRAASIRPRNPEEVPSEPGFCLDHAFIAESTYRSQEMVNVGIFMPSLPDVTFSISSNKDAYADYPKDEFERKKKEELSLLARIRAAQKEQGMAYPQRTVLREGKRSVMHWDGEESLIKRPDGVHDFEWGYIGKPLDVAYPSEIIVNMYSKVEHDQVGAAKVVSVSDDEALAVWDKLLAGLQFRVKVPGAPPGSYPATPAPEAGGAVSQ